MVYGAEALRSDEGLLERTEMKMLRWMLGITLKDKKRYDDIRHAVGVSCITEKIRKSRLRWYGHVQRQDDRYVKRILEAEVYGCRNRGRQRKRWINTMARSHQPEPVDVEDRDDWGTRVADPSPEGFTASRKERPSN